MRKRTKRYPEEFKKDAVRMLLSRGERTADEVAEGLGVRTNMLYRWKLKYSEQISEATMPSKDSKQMEAMRRRLRELEMENALLKKAAAFFAKETL